ncbi:MAG: hypothetical protein ACREP6_10520 [Candidatus Binataceae bacterium]
MAKKSRAGNIAVAPDSGDANLAAVAETRRRALKRKVRIFRGQGRVPGRIELEFYDDSDLTALAAALTAGASTK